MSASEINHAAVRILWEGLNRRGQFRRVLYFPFMDNYVMLLVTDADGNTKQTIRAEDFSKQYLPDEYIDDVPDEYTWGRVDPNDR